MTDDGTHREIEALIAAQDAAWVAGDAEAFAARARADISFTNIVGMFSVGRAPFVAQHAHIFATFYRGTTLRQSLANLARPRPDVAIVDTLGRLTGARDRPPGVEPIDGAIQTRLQQVLVRETDGWWVAAFHNVAVHPVALAPRPA